MGKVKRIVTLISITSIALCSLMGSFLMVPVQKAEAALVPLKINEFMPNPSSGLEWIEIYNPNPTPRDLSGYQLDDEGGAIAYTIPAGTVVAGYGFYVKETTFGLNNPGDTARLLNPSNDLVDSYTYSGSTSGKTYARSIDGAGVWSDGTTSPTKSKSNDITAPSGGLVNDGLVGNVEFIATTTEVSANWTGFVENESVLIEYDYEILDSTMTVIASGTVGGSENSFTHSGLCLTEGEMYKIRIKAINNAGLESCPVISDGQTPDVSGPTDPSDLKLTTNKPFASDGVVNLSWKGSTDALSGVDKYQIWRVGDNPSCPSCFYKIGEAGHFAAVTDYSYVDTTVFGDGYLYSYYIVAVDIVGNLSFASGQKDLMVDTVAPNAPTIDFTRDDGIVYINWPQVPGATSYEVYKNGVLVYVSSATAYMDVNTINGQTYSYFVKALDGAGNKSSASNTLEVYIPSPRVSSTWTTKAVGSVLGAETAQAAEVTEEEVGEESIEEDGDVAAAEESEPEETAGETKTNWSLIIAIIIAAAIVVAGVLYWWYAREEDEI